MGSGAALEKAIVPGISVAARLAWPMGPTAREELVSSRFLFKLNNRSPLV